MISPIPPSGVLEEVLAQALLEKVGVLASVVPFFVAELPLPPGINRSYQPVRSQSENGHMRLAHTLAARRYTQDAALLLSQAQHVDRAVIAAIQASKKRIPIAVELKFYLKTLWRRDLDGPVKMVQDVLFAHVGLDDRQVVALHATKQVDAQCPRVEIALRCLVFPQS